MATVSDTSNVPQNDIEVSLDMMAVALISGAPGVHCFRMLRYFAVSGGSRLTEGR